MFGSINVKKKKKKVQAQNSRLDEIAENALEDAGVGLQIVLPLIERLAVLCKINCL